MDGTSAMTRRTMLLNTGTAIVGASLFSAVPVASARSAAGSQLTPGRRATFAALVDAVAEDPGLAAPVGGASGAVDWFVSQYAADTPAGRAQFDTVLDVVSSSQDRQVPFAQRSKAQRSADLKRNLRNVGSNGGDWQVEAFTRFGLTVAAAPFCPTATQVPPLVLFVEAA